MSIDSDEGGSGRTRLLAVGRLRGGDRVRARRLAAHAALPPAARGQRRPRLRLPRATRGPGGGLRGTEERLRWQSFETPALVYRQEVTFLGDRPPVIWAYDKLSRVERPGTPEEQEELRFGSGTLPKEFHQPYGGLFCGNAWRWE